MFAFVSAPIDTPTLSPFPILPIARSLADNGIGAEGASALAAVLKETKITNLKCAAAPKVFDFMSAPADTFANTSPFLAHFYLRQKRAHLLPWSLSSLPPSLLHRLPHSHPRDAALDRAPRGPWPRPPVPDGWFSSTPCRVPPPPQEPGTWNLAGTCTDCTLVNTPHATT